MIDFEAAASKMRTSLPLHAARIVQNIGIAISVQRAFEKYANALTYPSEFSEARDAVAWWECGGWRYFWRHKIYPLLALKRYRQRREQQERGRAMMRQAVLNAVLDSATAEGGTVANIDKMKAGPELNVLVAEKVMGEAKPSYTYKWERALFDSVLSKKGAWLWRAIYEEGDIPGWYPKPFSASLIRAWEVDKPEWRWTFAEHPQRLTVLLWRQPEEPIVSDGSTVTLDSGPIATAHVKWDEVGTKAQAYALGRCRAALKAAEGRGEDR